MWQVMMFFLVFFPSSAFALIFGEPMPAQQVATGQLQVEQLQWYGGTNSMVTVQDQCSSVVVGTQPLTIITVAHCLRDAKLHPKTRKPTVKLWLGQPVPTLRAALYNRFHDVEQNLANDLAVLVFDGNAPDGITAMPIVNSLPRSVVMLCGYGRGNSEPQRDQPSCASKTVLSAEEDFYQFVPQHYEQLDPLLHLQFRAQFQAKRAMIRSINALLAVNRIENDRYQFQLPMPTRGDSGGPWLVRQDNGQQGVIAVTSFIETFYRKNKQWPFFKEHPAPLSDFPYAAYGVRLDIAEAKALFKRAQLEGADITILE